jgi:hypothetical protein
MKNKIEKLKTHFELIREQGVREGQCVARDIKVAYPEDIAEKINQIIEYINQTDFL